MRFSRRWRQRLLGSLQGQLQLATYLVVFVGFTTASTAGLWVGQRNLISNEVRVLRRSADSIQLCLTDEDQTDDEIRKELMIHSSVRTSLWIERKDGSMLLPPKDRLAHSLETIYASMEGHTERIIGSQKMQKRGERRLLSELVDQFPSGSRLWILHEVGFDQRALSNYLGVMTVIWVSCLALTLLAVSWLVRRIVQPLDQLNAATSQVTAETLKSAHLSLEEGPVEVMQLGRTYNDLLNRLAMSWSQQRQFVSAVSHELRTPLTIVQGYLHRTIKRSDNLTEEQMKGLKTAESESIRMRRLMDDLLDLSRNDSGRLDIATESVQLADQLEQVWDMARNTLQRPLLLQLPDNPQERDVVARADPPRLRQVLLDLIENADKYSPKQHPVRIVLRQEPSGSAIDVIDQGIGIPKEELQTVFDRFQRGSNAPAKTGSGLGLSVVKLLVEGMGGRIEVVSRLNEGSCFTVHLQK